MGGGDWIGRPDNAGSMLLNQLQTHEHSTPPPTCPLVGQCHEAQVASSPREVASGIECKCAFHNRLVGYVGQLFRAGAWICPRMSAENNGLPAVFRQVFR